MEELKAQESEALDIIESLLDVADMKCTGPLYADDPPRSGMCRIPEDDAAKLRQYIANRRAKPENKPLTNFGHIIERPETLGKFLQAINNGYIHFDSVYCHAQCDDGDNCPHELQCITDWLNQPYASSRRGAETNES